MKLFSSTLDTSVSAVSAANWNGTAITGFPRLLSGGLIFLAGCTGTLSLENNVDRNMGRVAETQREVSGSSFVDIVFLIAMTSTRATQVLTFCPSTIAFLTWFHSSIPPLSPSHVIGPAPLQAGCDLWCDRLL